MRLVILCPLSALLVTVLLSTPSEGWWFVHVYDYDHVYYHRYYKRGGVPTSKECPFTCRRYCPKKACSLVCANACALAGQAHNNKHLKPFPSEFKTYDLNKDGFITVDEFAKTIHVNKESGEVAVKLADDNGDWKLSEKEFDEAPYHKEKKKKGQRQLVRQLEELDEPQYRNYPEKEEK